MTTTLERPQAQAVEAGAFAPRQLWASLPDALRKLDPRAQLRNPVMFVVWVGSVLVTISAIAAPSVFAVLIAVWLWFTVLFANLAEAVAEGRGKPRPSRCGAPRRRRWRASSSRLDSRAAAASSRSSSCSPSWRCSR
jgi:K+-transporting ATPase ATPase B chain